MEWFLYQDKGSPLDPVNYVSMAGEPTVFKKWERMYAIRAKAAGRYPDITSQLESEIRVALKLKRSTESVRLKP